MSFPDHGIKRKVVDNVEHYINMKFQPKLMTRSRENGQKQFFFIRNQFFAKKKWGKMSFQIKFQNLLQFYEVYMNTNKMYFQDF